MSTERIVRAVVVGSVVALAGVPARAHQTLAADGVAVTLHVTPDDEPIAGKPATIDVAKVKVGRGARVRWKRCQCALTISAAAGSVIEQRPVDARTRISLFTFPAEGAYALALSGRYRRKGHWRPFTVTFPIRAVADGASA